MNPLFSEPNRVVAQLSGNALRKNFSLLRKQVPHQEIIAMVKANAYGHDAAWVVGELLRQKGLYGFGVATTEEGAELRRVLKNSHSPERIIIFSGTSPWTDEKGHLCRKYGLIPVLSSISDWNRFLKDGWADRIEYQLKFNTGMNRLGLELHEALHIRKILSGRPSSSLPSQILSHLALAESPDHPVSRAQLQGFQYLRGLFEPLFPSIRYHLANSAAIWNQEKWKLSELSDLVRPGLALYGVPPWAGAKDQGLSPVMRLQAQVIATRRLQKGERIGYGATFQAKRDLFTAILGAGYEDGIPRLLSNRGSFWLHSKAAPIIGRISMDLSTVQAPIGTLVGEWAEILGPHIDIWKQAQAAGTIPYELLTSVSLRVQRKYG